MIDTEKHLMQIMTNVSTIPFADKFRVKKRTIYEAGKGRKLAPSGHFYIDFAAYDGSTEEVSKSLIDRLEAEGKLVRAFPDNPKVNGWVIA